MAKVVKDKKENKRYFFKDFKAELKKVIWPTPKQVVNNTVAVVTIVLLTALIVFVLDLVFEKINTNGIDKLRNIVNTQESNSVETNSVESNTIESNTVEETTTENTESIDTSSEDNTISE